MKHPRLPLGQRLFMVPLGLTLLGCNQPPEIVQVGDYQMADSFLDYLHGDVTQSASFGVYAGETLTFRVIAVDPEGDPIRYAAGPLPIGAEFDEQKGVFEWTPTFEQGETGVWVDVYIVAMDDAGGWDATVVGVSAYGVGFPGTPQPPRSTWNRARFFPERASEPPDPRVLDPGRQHASTRLEAPGWERYRARTE